MGLAEIIITGLCFTVLVEIIVYKLFVTSSERQKSIHVHTYIKIGEFSRDWRPESFSIIPMKGVRKFANMFCTECGDAQEVPVGGEMHNI